MFLISIDLDFKVVGVSRGFVDILGVPLINLKNAYVLSMVDCETPDQCLEDMIESLERGLVYNLLLKFNVLKVPTWFDVGVTYRYSEGLVVGYILKLEEPKGDEIKSACTLYSKVKSNLLVMKNGFPITNEIKCNIEESEIIGWARRVK